MPQERTYDDYEYQYELDAATIYSTIENEIAPDYYDIDNTGRSSKWIGYIKNTVSMVASNFTTNRMLSDYCKQYYFPQSERYSRLAADGGKLAKDIAAWKKFVGEEWNNMRIVSYTQPNASYTLSDKNKLESEVVIDLGRLKPEDIGVEMLLTSTDAKGQLHIQEVFNYELVSYENGVATFKTSVLPERTGMYEVGTRVYPKNAELPHRQDFPMVKWL